MSDVRYNQLMKCRRDVSLMSFWIDGIKDRSGGVAVTFAVALPVLALTALGALDVSAVVSGRTYLQQVADAAALQGASQLTFDQSNATNQRTINFAEATAGRLGAEWSISAAAQSELAAGSMTVTISANHKSAVGNLVMPSGWHVRVSATALANARRPLCVLGTEEHQNDVVRVQDRSSVLSPDCMIQSDNDVHVDRSASISAGDVHAVGSASGSISPAALTNSPSIADPFSDLDISIPSACTDSDKLQLTTGTERLNPGVHCGTANLSGDANLILNPGEHYFIKGNFKLTGSAQLIGSDVVLIFKAHYDLKFDQDASMSLEGRRRGPYAGFVLVTSRQYQGSFEIATDRARKLLGTIYLPSTNLMVSGENNAVADQSPWTVVVARKIQINGSARLVLNANYNASTVPVPNGVGPSGVKLTK